MLGMQGHRCVLPGRPTGLDAAPELEPKRLPRMFRPNLPYGMIGTLHFRRGSGRGIGCKCTTCSLLTIATVQRYRQLNSSGVRGGEYNSRTERSMLELLMKSQRCTPSLGELPRLYADGKGQVS